MLEFEDALVRHLQSNITFVVKYPFDSEAQQRTREKHNRALRTLAFAILCIPSILFPQFNQPNFGGLSACDFCLAAQGISPLEVGSSGMRVDVRYLSVGTLYQDGSKTSNAGHELETHLTQQYTLFYALSKSVSLSALVPVPRRHSEQLSSQGLMLIGNQFGIGDIAFLARYKPYVGHGMESTYILSLVGGLKLSTGRTDGRDSQGDLLDACLWVDILQ